MMKVVSIWIRYPISGWSEFTKEQYEQVSRKYTCTLELLNDVCICNDFDIASIRLPATELISGKCMKQTCYVKEKWQIENPQANQAEYEIRMVMEVC